MIHLLELDLSDPHASLPPLSGEAWVLVRLGAEPLGEARVQLDPLWRGQIERSLAERYAPKLVARTVIHAERTETSVPSADGVSVVVCTRDRAQFLDGCLSALQSLDPQAGEVIVVDNAPTTKETRRVAESYACRYVIESVPGLNHARNRGWRSAHQSIVSYVDDDARADRWFAQSVARQFAAPEVGAVTGLVLAGELASYPQIAFERIEGGMNKGFERLVFHETTSPAGLEKFRLGVGTNMSFRKDVLESIDGFDERIGVGTATRGGCDLDALDRVLSAGYAIIYEPAAIIRHIHRRDRRALIGQLYDYGISFASLLEAHARRSPRDASEVRRYRARWHVRRHVIRLVRALASGQVLEAQMVLAEARGSLRGRRAFAAATGKASCRTPPDQIG